MNHDENIELVLWDYIDGNIPASDRSAVEKLLVSDDTWKSKYAELLEIHLLIKDGAELNQPSLRFTQNVMEEISRLYVTPATSAYINKNVIRGIGLFFLVSIVGLLIYSFSQVTWTTADTGFMPDIDYTSINSSVIMNSTHTKIFMMVNVILALMLLDMYLTKRKNLTNLSNDKKQL